MYNLQELLNALPPMLAGKELMNAMTILPEYSENVRWESDAIRLMALSNIYKVYVPSQMSSEIYSKLYLALLRSLQKKTTITAVKQQNENFKAIRQHEYTGILGGSDSFTIIGTSGIGKSSTISRAISLISCNGIIEVQEPHSRIIPCLVVQCPFDSSVKALLLEILRKVDEPLESHYYQNAVKSKATVDMLIGSVSQIALNHIGLLIVDEIQNVVNSKNGKSLVGMLTQLINNSGISICMVGTPESSVFFEQALQLARRSLGLQYSKLEYTQQFYDFCNILFEYQYVNQQTVLDEGIAEWLYEHSGGVVSIVVSLIHDAQEIAILNGKEILNLETLNEAYLKRMTLLHGYIEPDRKMRKQAQKAKSKLSIPEPSGDVILEYGLADLVSKAKSENRDVVELIKQHIIVEEVMT